MLHPPSSYAYTQSLYIAKMHRNFSFSRLWLVFFNHCISSSFYNEIEALILSTTAVAICIYAHVVVMQNFFFHFFFMLFNILFFRYKILCILQTTLFYVHIMCVHIRCTYIATSFYGIGTWRVSCTKKNNTEKKTSRGWRKWEKYKIKIDKIACLDVRL